MFAVAMMVVVAVGVGALRRHHLRGRDAALLIVAANVASLYRYIGLALLLAIFLGCGGPVRDGRARPGSAMPGSSPPGVRRRRRSMCCEMWPSAMAPGAALRQRTRNPPSSQSIRDCVRCTIRRERVGPSCRACPGACCCHAARRVPGAWRVRDAAFRVGRHRLDEPTVAPRSCSVDDAAGPDRQPDACPLVAPAALVLGYGWSTAWRWHARSRTPGDPNEFHTPEGASALRALSGSWWCSPLSAQRCRPRFTCGPGRRERSVRSSH